MGDPRADFLFEAGGFGADTWRVVRFQGTEAISQPFQFDIDLEADDPNLDFDAIVGKPGTLTIALEQGERRVHGVVCRFELTHLGRTGVRYAARLVPRAWTLSLRRQSRVFPERTTPQILHETLEAAGVPTDAFRIQPKRKFAARHFCVQYRESDLDFLSRIAEEDGFFSFFDHSGDTELLIVADHNEKFLPIAGGTELPFRLGDTGLVSRDEVRAFRFGQSVRSGAVSLRDFDFKKPSLSLEAGRAANAETALEVYDFPGAFPDVGLAKEIAAIRLEEARAERLSGSGESNCARLFAGGLFGLAGHPNASFDREYLLTRVHHWGSQPQASGTDGAGAALPATYRNEFECIPSDVPYRPPRVTPQPRIEGSQTAIVTGPDGAEIHTDEFGRVTVRFPWDRRDVGDDTSSYWVRVSQGSGGAGWGTVFIPRVGNEVVVEFLEGDPNRPVITGRVFNGANPPPFALPANKTVSGIKTSSSPGGSGFNGVRLEDAAGRMLFDTHAEKDMNIDVANNKLQSVGNQEKLTVGFTRRRSVGRDETVAITGNQAQLIRTGTTLKVGGSQTIAIGGSQIALWGFGKSEKVIGNWIEKVNALRLAMSTGSIKLDVKGSIEETIGALKLTSMRKDFSRDSGDNDTVKTAARLVKTKGGFSLSSAVIDYIIGGLQFNKIGGDYTVKGKTITLMAAVMTMKGGGSVAKLQGGPVILKGSKLAAGKSAKIKIKGTIKVN